jgi:hypothetical protein
MIVLPGHWKKAHSGRQICLEDIRERLGMVGASVQECLDLRLIPEVQWIMLHIAQRESKSELFLHTIRLPLNV